MREFDLEGLRLAEYQGKIFEASSNLECSTAIFMRRFLHSNFLMTLDKNDWSILTLDVKDAFSSVNEQFGKTTYGKKKEAKEALFWIGYLYRYISYTRNVSVRFLLNNFDYKDLIPLYYVYHTQDMEWCVRSILEKYGIDEGFLDANIRLKRIMQGRPYRLRK